MSPALDNIKARGEKERSQSRIVGIETEVSEGRSTFSCGAIKVTPACPLKDVKFTPSTTCDLVTYNCLDEQIFDRVISSVRCEVLRKQVGKGTREDAEIAIERQCFRHIIMIL